MAPAAFPLGSKEGAVLQSPDLLGGFVISAAGLNLNVMWSFRNDYYAYLIEVGVHLGLSGYLHSGIPF